MELDHASRLSRVHLQRIAEFLADRTVRLTTDDLAEFSRINVEPTLINLANATARRSTRLRAGRRGEERTFKPDRPQELASAPNFVHRGRRGRKFRERRARFVAQSFRESVVQMRRRPKLASDLSIPTTNADHRIEAVDAFQMDRNRVFLATTAAGGLSVSLHRLREGGRPRTSIIRVSYSVSELAQALGRIYRAGMLDKTVVQRLPLVAGTPEERIYVRLQHKLRNMKTMVDDDLI